MIAKFIIFVMGWIMLVPAMFLVFTDSLVYACLGVIYFVVVVFSGSEHDRKFWKVWWNINKSLFPLPKEYDN